MSSHASLDAAAQDRKARLAKLKSLKRKQASDDCDGPENDTATEEAQPPSVTSKFLSGRNYDAETRGPKLGFEQNPSENQDTAEVRAQGYYEEVKAQAAQEQKEDKPLDLFKLQPKKANWDLKRDMDKKMEVLNVRTDNAIARLVRERIQSQKQNSNDEAAGLVGEELVSTLHAREQQEQEEEARERRENAEIEEGFT